MLRLYNVIHNSILKLTSAGPRLPLLDALARAGHHVYSVTDKAGVPFLSFLNFAGIC
jgi:hypothetical protein